MRILAAIDPTTPSCSNVLAASAVIADSTVVLGSRAHSFAERLLGTTAAEVVDHAGRSVLVVKRPWRSDV